MKIFGGIKTEAGSRDNAAVLLQPVPYDGSSTWGKGADRGPEALLQAAENMELYDIETDSEVFRKGIFVLPDIIESASPEAMTEAVYQQTKMLLKEKRFLTFIGGEHSISIGIMRAFQEKWPGLTVLQLDAHADLRESYNGSKCNHACAMYEFAQKGNLLQVGIRSMDVSEKKLIQEGKVFFAQDILNQEEWMLQALDAMTEHVYISIDLDVFDPSVMPSTGTPEPGGMYWYQVLKFLGMVFRYKSIVGFDIVELAPNTADKAPDMLAAKLYYKLLSYKFSYDEPSHD